MEAGMTRKMYQGEYFSIYRDVTDSEFVGTSEDEVLVVALTAQGEVLLTIEPSPAFGEPSLILPGGGIVVGEEQAETARRELQEEIGHLPRQLDFLGELRPHAKYLAARSFVYLGRDLVPGRLQGDERYEIGIERVPLSRFEELIAAGRLLDARAIAALYLARNFLSASAG
jgi:ADP-ribose diphosphatase